MSSTSTYASQDDGAPESGFHHSAAGAFADLDHGVAAAGRLMSSSLIEKLSVKILGLFHIGGVQFDMTKWIRHNTLLCVQLVSGRAASGGACLCEFL
jgi:hypothetical protein